jgi:hypothetical protein
MKITWIIRVIGLRRQLVVVMGDLTLKREAMSTWMLASGRSSISCGGLLGLLGLLALLGLQGY